MRIPFETLINQGLRMLRRTSREEQSPEIGGYTTSQGEVRGLSGDDTGPYTHAIGRASSDGTTGSVAVANGDPQRLLTDLYGAIWAQITGAVTLAQPVKMEGDTAHDAVDDDAANPVKIGGRAIATVPAVVTALDRVNALFDLFGRLGIIPWTSCTEDVIWRAAAALAAAGATQTLAAVDVTHYRQFDLKVTYTRDAGSVAGYPRIVLLVSSKAAPGAFPATLGADWFFVEINNGVVTVSNEKGIVSHLSYVAEFGTAASIPLNIPLAIQGVRWIMALVNEQGDVALPGTLRLAYSMSN